MVSRPYGAGPQLLPGRSAGALLWAALRWVWLAVLAVPAMVVQAYVPYQAVWVAGWAVVAAVGVLLFARGLLHARDREREEVARGYTTMLQVARERPDLFLVDAETGTVLSAPGQARPPDVRRKTVQAWLAQQQGSG